jgi:zinc protease
VNGRLPNGVSTLVVEQHEQPVVSISLAMPAGSFYVPQGKEGLAGLVASLLTKGTERRTADQLSAEIEGAGGSIDAGADADFLTVTVSGLSKNADQLFDILGDVIQHSTLPATEVELARTRAVSGLQAALSEPSVIASRIFNREVYGTHPYGRASTTASLQGLTRDDVAGFYQARIRPAGALLVVAGDLTPARARQLALHSLGAWSGAPAAAPEAPALPALPPTGIILVHKPGAVQSNIVAGFPLVTPRDPHSYALTMVNGILGGGADARLFMILREQKGWTYGAYSSFSRPRGVGAFSATAEVRTPVTDSALAELMHQLDRIRNEPAPDSEVTNVRNYLVGRFPLQIETADQIADQVATARLLGLPDDYVLHYRERLAAVTRAQITQAAHQFLTTDRMVIVVVGDGTKVLEGLKKLGSVRIVSPDGTPMTEADLAPRAGTVAFAADHIHAGTQHYRVMVQGNPLGTEDRTFARVQENGRDAWQIVTATEIGPIVTQHDTTTIDAATLAPIRVRQGGMLQGQRTFVTLDYAGGRVRGGARAPRPTGIVEQTIDTTAAAGVIDDNELAAIVLALPYAANARWTLQVFDAARNETETATATVSGEETENVPAGAIACWKVELTGLDQAVTFYIAKDSPAIVKLEIQGVPIAFELTQR